ncbi:regulatory protein IclR [Arthrobacter crystallopoietes BAB-32]|uniref:Regulatory protein IclR n=1 Tax=Arthrobacter crystallopoietes BAB-32 TaxID=1246476 RepID=N1V524_9MICC|nr:sugar ABC transporter substrate-binding protein [Arthrobacter crystallopoietes]EMY35187.1 regulatory protein IclR [Arthrobacter crystallopoietes BAB-32]
MRNIRRTIIATAALAGFATLTACGSSASAGTDTVSIAYAGDQQTPFVATVTEGIDAAASAAGAEFSVFDNHTDAAKVVNNARDAATQAPSVFIEYSSVADANDRVDRIMDDAGVPVLAVQYPVGDAPLFAIDNAEVGRLGGDALADAALEKWGEGEVDSALMLALPAGGDVQLERSDAAQAALEGKLGSIDVTVGDTKLDPSVARQVSADFLSAHPGEKIVVWAHLDSMAMGAVSAAKAAGREDDVLIVGTSGDPVVVDELKREGSPLVATVGLFPEQWGEEIVDLATRVAAGEEVPEVTHPSQTRIVTAENADDINGQE